MNGSRHLAGHEETSIWKQLGVFEGKKVEKLLIAH